MDTGLARYGVWARADDANRHLTGMFCRWCGKTKVAVNPPFRKCWCCDEPFHDCPHMDEQKP